MSKEFKIGLMVVVAGVLFYYGFNFLKGKDLFASTNRFYAVYPNITGLNLANSVYFNGLPVGKVAGLELNQKKKSIIVTLEIDKQIQVPQHSTAILANDGLFGGKAILLDEGISDKLLKSGDTLLSRINGDLLSHFEPVADNLNATFSKINNLLDKLNEVELSGLISNVHSLIEEMKEILKATNPNVQSTLGEYKLLATNLNTEVGKLGPTIKKLGIFADTLNKVQINLLVKNLNVTVMGINSLVQNLQSEKGTMGKLMKDDKVYKNLEQVLVKLDQLVTHFNDYPRDFLKPLGRKHKKLKGGPLTEKENE